MTRLIAVVAVFFAGAASATAQDVAPLLTKIKAVGKEGTGNVDAIKAWKELTKHGPEVLVDILSGFADANPVAANWLRSAVESIADRTLRAGKTLPADKLEKFVRDQSQDGAARYLAYEWLVRIDYGAVSRFFDDLKGDPSAELRRVGVERLILRLSQAKIHRPPKVDEKAEKWLLQDGYRAALSYARDRDQVLHVARELKSLGVDVDLTKHFGFITEWMLLGPFDSTDGKGFHTVFPPDRKVDLAAEYEGKEKKRIRWFKHATKADFGVVDFNKEIGHLKAAAAFAFTVVESATERPVDIRVGSNNAVRIYLNGAEIFFREEYHHGMKMDQYIGKGKLKAGRNDLLIKVCQNEQTESWAQLWSFQLRVCDAIGGAVPVTVVTEQKP